MGMTTEVELDREAVRVIEWRMEWLCGAGYTKRNAQLIATSEIDWRYACDLLENCKKKGYDEQFVMELLF